MCDTLRDRAMHVFIKIKKTTLSCEIENNVVETHVCIVLQKNINNTACPASCHGTIANPPTEKNTPAPAPHLPLKITQETPWIEDRGG